MDDSIRNQLEQIAGGDADALTVEHLGDAARSLKELIGLFGWLRQHRAHLVADDVRLDTRQPQGRHMVALLEEIARWERAPEKPRGRPGLANRDPELAERIASLRARGLSLSSIADVLNDNDVPTPRGGATWRASSVQSALGYRRPAPLPPGAPKPPRPRRPDERPHDRPHDRPHNTPHNRPHDRPDKKPHP